MNIGVDTSTPAGEMMVSVMASFAQYERRLIGQRTKDALAALKARGVRLGRPVNLPDSVRQRISRRGSYTGSWLSLPDWLWSAGAAIGTRTSWAPWSEGFCRRGSLALVKVRDERG